MKFVSVYVTASTKKEAETLSRKVLEKRLAACANTFPVSSLYWWKGRIEKAKEVAVVFKTRASLARRLAAEVRRLHSYDVPCVVAWPIAHADPRYAAWVRAETGP
ncbi:MAG: divalent-cation tolerance protein CutA [Methanobacteriota archaeon]